MKRILQDIALITVFGTASFAQENGAGVKGGVSYGETDNTASKVIKNPVTISDINATIAHLAGLDVLTKHASPSGRPFEIAAKGKVITDIVI